MKRCPECDSVFPETDQFCELDGTRLVIADRGYGAMVSENTEQKIHNVAATTTNEAVLLHEASWKKLAVVGIGGVAVGVILFLIYYAMTRPPAEQSSNKSSSKSSVVQQQGPLLPSQPSPVPSASLSQESSPSPSGIPSPLPQATARVELSSSPISTSGSTKNGHVLLRLTDGTSIEADEAWQTQEGIWYRRRGIMTLLNPKQVETIEKVPLAAPQPTAPHSPTP